MQCPALNKNQDPRHFHRIAAHKSVLIVGEGSATTCILSTHRCPAPPHERRSPSPNPRNAAATTVSSAPRPDWRQSQSQSQRALSSLTAPSCPVKVNKSNPFAILLVTQSGANHGLRPQLSRGRGQQSSLMLGGYRPRIPECCLRMAGICRRSRTTVSCRYIRLLQLF